MVFTRLIIGISQIITLVTMITKVQRVIYTLKVPEPSSQHYSLYTTEDEDFQTNKDSVTNLFGSWKNGQDISVYSEYLMSLKERLHTIDTQGS